MWGVLQSLCGVRDGVGVLGKARCQGLGPGFSYGSVFMAMKSTPPL